MRAVSPLFVGYKREREKEERVNRDVCVNNIIGALYCTLYNFFVGLIFFGARSVMLRSNLQIKKILIDTSPFTKQLDLTGLSKYIYGRCRFQLIVRLSYQMGESSDHEDGSDPLLRWFLLPSR